MLGKPMPVRFSEETDQRLAEIAATNGMTKADLIRLCVERELQEIDRTGKIEVTQVVVSARHKSKRSA